MARRRMRVVTPEAPSIDSTPRGSIDTGVLLSADAAQMVAEIERGEHDAHLSDLEHAERTRHDRSSVLAAFAKRRALG